jgi:transcriptional regulator with XRE-family HTH domain
MKHWVQRRQAITDPGTAVVPMPAFTKPDPTARGGVPLGRLLETARKRVSMTEAGAANRLRISEREIVDFESGMRTPSNDLMDEMCDIYGTSRDRMVSDAGIAVDDPENPRELWIGWAAIELEGVGNRDRIFRIASTFRELRHLAEDAPVIVRDEELLPVCRSIDVADEELMHDLSDAFLLGQQQTAELFARMRYRVSTVKELPGPRVS